MAVIIPCHDDGDLVAEAVSSVLQQDEPCELVVVDDESTDPVTLEVLARLEQDGTRILREENQGPSGARMAGVRATTAPYVLPLDADDLLPRDAATTLANALSADPGLQLAWGNTEIFGVISQVQPMARELDPWRITYLNELPITSMVRRSAIATAGGWEVTGGYEDWELWMRFAERGWRGANVGRITFGFRAQASPRRYTRSRRRHEENRKLFRQRRAALYAMRRRNWLASPSPWRIKLTFPLVEALPLSEMRRQQLLYALRYILQPSLTAGFRSLTLSVRGRVPASRKPVRESSQGREEEPA